MSRAVMISIKPKWVELIASGKNTVEVRKTRPKIDVPFKCYIYCTLNGSNELFHETLNGDVARWNREKWWDKKGKVVGEFVCDKIGDYVEGFSFNSEKMCISLQVQACLTQKEVWNYSCGKDLYGWHISNLKMYDKPKELSEFYYYAKDCKSDRCDTCWYHDYSIKDEPCNSCRLDVLDRVYLWRPPQSWGYVEELK